MTGLFGWIISPAPKARGQGKGNVGKSNQRDGLIAGDAALMGGKATDRRQYGHLQ